MRREGIRWPVSEREVSSSALTLKIKQERSHPTPMRGGDDGEGVRWRMSKGSGNGWQYGRGGIEGGHDSM
jgi:hypothetical protein